MAEDADAALLHPDPDGAATPGAHAAGLELDTPFGPLALGPPTVDSDGDGHPDTVVIGGDADPMDLRLGGEPADRGTTEPTGGSPAEFGLATDLDGDAHVDVLTTIGPDGAAHTTTFPHPPAPTRGDRWDEGEPGPPPVLDPQTGFWTRARSQIEPSGPGGRASWPPAGLRCPPTAG